MNANTKNERSQDWSHLLGNDLSNQVAIVTIVKNNVGNAAKEFWLNQAGKLQSRSAAQIWDGIARQESAADLDDFLRIRSELSSNEAMIYGVFKAPLVAIGTQNSTEVIGGASAARDRAHTSFRKKEPGIWFTDHDPRKGAYVKRDWRELDEIFSGLMPEIAETHRAWVPSSSAYIRNKETMEDLIGIGGWRAYMVVDDASMIPALTALLYQRLWDNGHGFVEFSDGEHPRRLDRSLSDASVAQPERLDFAAPPIMKDQRLERFAPAPVILPGAPMLDTSLMNLSEVPDLKVWRKGSTVLQKALADALPEAAKRLENYTGKRIGAAKLTQPELSAKRIRQITERAVERNVLSGDFELTLADGSKKLVRELLADPDRYHEIRMPDPLEPTYRGDKRIAVAYLKPDIGDDPIIWSHAHSGILYRLVLESAEIELKVGEQPQAVDETMRVVRARGDIYERGNLLVRVGAKSNGIIPVVDAWFEDYLGRCVRYFEWRKGKDENGVPVPMKAIANVPAWLPRRLNAKEGEWGVPALNGVITAPTLRADGSLLCEPGYDKVSGLLVRGGPFAPIPERPTELELQRAFNVLWWPVRLFPYETPDDRGAMLASLLTALIRLSLEQAPGVLFDATQAGTGKTFLALCLLALSGAQPFVQGECKNPEEFNKTLLATVLSGQSAMAFDNVRGEMVSGTLEAFLTAPMFEGRILGVSKMAKLDTRVLTAITGNNFRAGGDLFRRLIRVRLNAQMADPEQRAFDFVPWHYCRDWRQQLVTAGLTLLRGFLAAGAPRIAAGSTASFEQWDSLVRQCVLWLGQQGIALTANLESFGDPTACQKRMKEVEPGRQKLAAFHAAVYGVFGPATWTVKTLLKRIDRNTVLLDERDEDGPLHQLLSTVEEIAGERGGINPRILGGWIKNQRGARSGELYLVDEGVDSHTKNARWSVQSDATYG